jgi:tRNA(Ile)-lysidine synthase
VDTLNAVVDDIITAANGKPIWVAFSGGVDSHVLLHLLATHPKIKQGSVHAIHVNHGLQASADAWSIHCEQVANQLKVSFKTISVSVDNVDKLGMEAAARKARYSAIQDAVQPEDMVLTAQHQHDQAETLMLQLIRGAGPKGLSAMPIMSSLGHARLFRPLLNISQSCISEYAYAHQLNWIEDPSNTETQWSRNYIRNEVWPIIEQRWPSASETLSRSASHCAEAIELMSDLAQLDLQRLGCQSTTNQLPISTLLLLSSVRYKNVLRYVFSAQNLAMPSTVVLNTIINDVCRAKTDSNPIVHFENTIIRRYRDVLFIERDEQERIMSQTLMLYDETSRILAKNKMLEWNFELGKGLKPQVLAQGIELRYRQGGERIKLLGHRQYKTLKHLFQEWGVPPWLRDTIPLLFYGDELIAVIGYAFADGYCVTAHEEGYIPGIKIDDCSRF